MSRIINPIPLFIFCFLVSILISINCTEDLPTPPPDPDDTVVVLVLAPPFDLSATGDSSLNISLWWDDTTQYQASYVIERADSAGAFVALDTNPYNAVNYLDTLPKNAHGTYRYRLFSFYDTLVSKFTDTVSVTFQNRAPVLTVKNYDALTNKVFMLGDTIPIYISVTDADNDSVVISNPDSQVVFLSDTVATFYVSDTLPDTLQFICDDLHGGSDSETVIIRYFNVNYGPVFNRVSLPPMGVAGKKVTSGYKVTDPDNDAVRLYVDSIIDPVDDPRKVKIVLEDSLFTFYLLPHDTGITPFAFIAEDGHKLRDTLFDTLFVVEPSLLIYNTLKVDSFHINRLASYNIDGSSGNVITSGGDSIGYPIVSPSNGKLIYTKDVESDREVRSVNVDGTWDQPLFTDTNKVFIPGSWAGDSAAVAFRMLVPGSSTWSIVTYTISTGLLDTSYQGLPIRGAAFGPIYTPLDSTYIIGNNDTLYSLALSQGMTMVAAGASHPQVMNGSLTLYYVSTASGTKLMKSDLSGGGAVAVADFADYTIDYVAADQTKRIVYGLAIKGTDAYGWVYFEKYNKFVNIGALKIINK